MSLIASHQFVEPADRSRSLGVTRRDLFGLAALSMGIPLAGEAASRLAGGRSQSGSATAVPAQRLPNLPTSFSSAERDRRWTRVRAMMTRERFDCIITPAGSGETGADSRYLTQMGGWVIFPLDGPVIAIADSEDIEDRKTVPDWVADVRPAEDGLWSPPIIEALRQLKMQQARIGVGRLDKVLRNQEGDVNFTTLDRIRQAVPAARFESAYDQMMRIKLVRSPEEIAVLERSVAAGERGIQAMIHAARPDIPHKDVWLEIFSAMTAATGEAPSRLAIRAGNEANTSTGGPMLEMLKAGQIMNQEISARVLGYSAQVNHSICIGQPPPADWPAAGRYCLDLFHELVDWIKPGKSFMDLCRFYVQKAQARGGEVSRTWVLVHTGGFGDGPRMGASRTETTDLMIEPGMAFTLKPRIVIKDTRPTAQFGDAVLVTDAGARRLGTRRLDLVTAGA